MTEEERLLVISRCWDEHDFPTDDDDWGHLFLDINEDLKAENHRPIRWGEFGATLLKAIEHAGHIR